jgi:hypothetical protein
MILPIRRNPEAPGPVPENRAAILRGGATETGNGLREKTVTLTGRFKRSQLLLENQVWG